jgi:cytochrome P450
LTSGLPETQPSIIRKGGFGMISDDDIVSPQLYADEARLHSMFEHLRRNDPLRWTEPTSYWPFWAVTKHADILEIETNNEVFVAGPRNRLLTIGEEDRIRAKTGGAPLMRSLPTMDNPDHRKYRMVTREWFMPANLKKLEPRLAALAREYVAKLKAVDGDLDFVREVSVWLPLRVIMMILGIPEKDGVSIGAQNCTPKHTMAAR